MARYSIATAKTTGAAAGLLAQLRAGAGRDLRLFEVAVFINSPAAATVGLIRPSAVGATFTSTVVGAPDDPVSAAGVAVVDTIAGTAPTIGANFFRRVPFPATVGAGFIWTFPNGVPIPVNGSFALWQISALAVTYETHWYYDE